MAAGPPAKRPPHIWEAAGFFADELVWSLMVADLKKMKKFGLTRRAPLFAALALAVMTGISAFEWYNTGRRISYTDFLANPSRGITLQPPSQRNPATPISFAAADGTPRNLGDFKGRAILVNLWATWCPPCVTEMPGLNALQAQLGSDRFQVITISLDRGGAPVAQSWLDRNHLDHLPAYNANPSNFTDAKLPTSLLIDAKGRLVWEGFGAKSWESPEIITLVRTLAGEQ